MTGANISPDFEGSSRRERRILEGLLKREKTPKAIRYFAENCGDVSDHFYWFTLSTLWVSYTGFTDLSLWRRLLSSPRPRRETSIMKPDELQVLRTMPEWILAYRAHRQGEIDWLSYTLSIERATMFAQKRGVTQIHAYEVPKSAVLAYFDRRGEFELLILNKTAARPVDLARMLQLKKAEAGKNVPS
jgi:hypothetical protein